MQHSMHFSNMCLRAWIYQNIDREDAWDVWKEQFLPGFPYICYMLGDSWFGLYQKQILIHKESCTSNLFAGAGIGRKGRGIVKCDKKRNEVSFVQLSL